MNTQTKKSGTLSLAFAWGVRSSLRAEGDKLWAEGAKLRAEGAKLQAEGAKLRAEGDKLQAEGAKLRAEGDKLWAEAILEVHGNIKVNWLSRTDGDLSCQLETGETFEPAGPSR